MSTTISRYAGRGVSSSKEDVHAAHVFFRFIIRLIFPIFVLNGGHAVLNFADGRQYRLLIQLNIFSLGFFLQFDIIDQFAPMKNRQR